MDVKTLCLAALSRGEASGYEIKKMFEHGPFAHLQRASFGSIYPALSRLLAEGLASAETHEQDGKPGKKVYRLTQTGRIAFETALNADPEPETVRSDFLFMLFFAARMHPDRANALIQNRISELRDTADRIDNASDTTGDPADAGARFGHGYGIAVYRAAADYLEQNAAGFLADLRRQHSHQTEAAE